MTDTAQRPIALAVPAVLHGENPFDVDPQTDLLAPRPDDGRPWGEHMFFHTWNPTDGVGVWIHVGRAVADPDLWWAQTFALLPNFESIASLTWGRSTDNRGPETGNLKITCVEPHRRWRLQFDGAGERTSQDHLSRGLVGAQEVVPMSFDIDLDTSGPVLDFVKATHIADWKAANLHHEQALTASGTMTVAGQSWPVDGTAFRDHSLGHRDLVEFGGAAWPTITFPDSGRIVQCLSLWSPARDVQGSMVSIWEDGRLEVTNDFHLTGLADPASNPTKLTLDIQRYDGSILTLQGENVHGITITMAEPNYNLNGAAITGYGDPLILCESINRWTWPDGEIGYGNTERDYRRSMLPSLRQPLPAGSRFQDEVSA